MSAALLATLGGVLAACALWDGAVAARGRRGAGVGAERRRGPRAAGRPGASWMVRAAPDAAEDRRRRAAAAALLGRLGVRTPASLEARLAAAGTIRAGAPEQAMALKCAAALGTALVTAPLVPGASPAAALVLLGGLPAGAFVLPDLLLARRAARRARLLRAQAPELLDRLRLGAEAGLGPQRALALAAGRASGLLAAEVRAALRATELGLTHEQALRRLCARCPVPEVLALAAALRRSARHGAPLAPPAAEIAAAARADRARRVQERAQGAAPKIQLVVALLLVPAALLLIGAAMLAGLR